MNCFIKEVEPENYHAVLPIIKRIFPNADLRVTEDDIIFIAITRSKVVGFLHLTEKQKSFVLRGIGIDSQYRNSGNGSTLMDKVDEIATVTGKKITLKVKALNPAVSLYERYGFTVRQFGAVYSLVKKVNS